MIPFMLAHPALTAVLVLVGLLVWKFVVQMYQVRAHLPPGPFPYPIVGNMLLFKGTTEPLGVTVAKMVAQYGDPVTIWLGWKPTIWLHKTDMIREVLIDNPHDFQSRPTTVLGHMFMNGSQDIIFGAYNDLWHCQKKIGSRATKRIVDSTVLADQVNDTVEEVVDLMLAENGPIVLEDYTTNIVFNVLLQFCFGERFQFDDPVFKRRMAMRREQLKHTEGFAYIEGVPFATNFADLICKFHPVARKLNETAQQQIDFNVNRFKKHKNNFDPNAEPSNIMDAILLEQQLESERGETTVRLDDKHLQLIIMDIIEAGTETSSNTLMWFFLEMVLEPGVQEKCAKLIEETIGTRAPMLSDRKALSFIEATILEVMRMHPVAPIGVPTSPSVPMAKLGKYQVPEETMVVVNVLSLHYDEQYWKNPQKFDPNRFLDEDGMVDKPPYWLPFGCGKRVCMGEQLAKNDLFLIVTGLLQRLRFKPMPGKEYNRVPKPMDFDYLPLTDGPVLIEQRLA